MKQLGLPDVDFPTSLLNDNQGSIDWIESGCKLIEKLRHENLSKLGIFVGIPIRIAADSAMSGFITDSD